MIVLDAHCDAPSQMYRLRDFGIDNERGQVDFPKMKRGGVDSSFFAIYVPASRGPQEATAYADDLIDAVERQLAANKGCVASAYTASEVKVNKENGLISILLGMENASPVQESFELLQHYKERGVRYITLTHSSDNQVCDSCTGKGTWGGLSPFGKKLVAEMNRSGMLIDLAHSSDDTMRDVLRYSQAPVAYTHGCCRAMASHRRNITDELMRGIAANGGVVGMSIYPCFLSDDFVKILKDSGLESKMWVEDDYIADPKDEKKMAAWWAVQDELAALNRPEISLVADHIEHAIEVAGIDHVGLGTDYDGIEVTPKGLENISGFSLILDELKSRGYGSDELSKVAGSNFLRLLDEVQRF